jgi:transposase
MGTTSVEVRRAIVKLRHEEELSYEEIAEALGVGRATVNRVLRRHREAGTVQPRPRGGGNLSPIRDRIARLLVAIVRQLPDATVAELADALAKRTAITPSRSAVQRALARLGYSKKRLHSWRPSATRRSTGSGGASSARSSPP